MKRVSLTSSNLFLCQLVKLTITKRSSIMSARSLNFFTPSLVSSMSYYRLRTENKCECGSSNRNNKKVIWTLSKFLLQIRKWKKKIKIKRNTIYNIESPHQQTTVHFELYNSFMFLTWSVYKVLQVIYVTFEVIRIVFTLFFFCFYWNYHIIFLI